MTETESAKKTGNGSPWPALSIIFGSALGSMLYVLTRNPVWMGLFVSAGVVVGVVILPNLRKSTEAPS